MKRFLSTLALAAQTSYLKVLAITAATAVIETCVFLLQLWKKGTAIRLEDFWQNNFLLQMIPLLGLVAIAWIMVSAYRSNNKSQPIYTLGRLSGSPVQFLLANGTYHALCYGFFTATLIPLFWGFCQYYIRLQGDEEAAMHTTFLVFQQVGFLHVFLPLHIWWGFLRNIIILWTYGIITAVINLTLLRKNFRWTGWPVYISFYFPFAIWSGNLNLDKPFVSGLCIIILLGFTLVYMYYAQKGGLFFEEDIEETNS